MSFLSYIQLVLFLCIFNILSKLMSLTIHAPWNNVAILYFIGICQSRQRVLSSEGYEEDEYANHTPSKTNFKWR
jgi:hypothetical protein